MEPNLGPFSSQTEALCTELNRPGQEHLFSGSALVGAGSGQGVDWTASRTPAGVPLSDSPCTLGPQTPCLMIYSLWLLSCGIFSVSVSDGVLSLKGALPGRAVLLGWFSSSSSCFLCLSVHGLPTPRGTATWFVSALAGEGDLLWEDARLWFCSHISSPGDQTRGLDHEKCFPQMLFSKKRKHSKT